MEKATVLPVANFNAVTDVQALHLTLTNGPDKSLLIDILCNRSLSQRLEISMLYFQNHGVTLRRAIRDKTKLNFSKLLCGLAMPYYQYLAKTIHNSSRFKWLFYILFTLPNAEIIEMKEFFESKYKTSIEKFLKAELQSEDEDCGSMIMKPIIKLLRANRDETDNFTDEDIKQEVQQLSNISEKFLEGNPQARVMIKHMFYTKSFNYIKQVAAEYSRQNGGAPIQEAIKKAYSFSIGSDDIFDCILKYSINPAFYFSFALRKSMKGLGTMDTLLTHIVIRRSEIDMIDIKTEFNRLTGDKLVDWIEGDTSRSYKIALCTLIGEGKK